VDQQVQATFTLASVSVANMTMDSAIDSIFEHADRGLPCDVHLVNAYNFVLASAERQYASALRGATLNLPDGRSLVVAATLLRAGRLEQVRGPSLFVKALADSRSERYSHFFLGGAPVALAALEERVKQRFPRAVVAGSYSPPFAPINDEEVSRNAQIVKESGADIVWLGLGTPKQDYLARKLSVAVSRPVVCVGAAFDFVGGVKREAPRFVQVVGAEWLFRLASEPRRLWRRYVLGNPRFIILVLKEMWSSR